MAFHDDDLSQFAAEGATPLPETGQRGSVQHDGASIWYAAFGTGPAVVLLHGGLGNSGNWGFQVPALVEAGYQAIVIDSRGHGRSSRDDQPYSYERMAGDVGAVLDTLQIEQAALVGWSDGACTALILADRAPERVNSVFFFACNMDPSGAIEDLQFTTPLQRCFRRHVLEYEQLSPTPGDFEAFAGAVQEMQQSQPNYSASDLARIQTPVLVVLGEHDEFIKRSHAEYMARSLPNAEFVLLPDVSHFAPLQRPDVFNNALLAFLARTAV